MPGMSKTTRSPGPRYEALLHVLRTSEALWNASREFFSEWALSPSQFNVLNLLGDFPEGCPQVELSRQLIMHRSNVTGLVDRLEGRGLVERKDDPGDRRTNLVRLTPNGEKLLRTILPRYFRAAETIWGDLPISRVKRIVSDLSRLRTNAASLNAGSQ